MARFQPKNPDFRRVATDTFDRQRAMRTLGISIARLEPGEVDLAMAYSPDCTQQNGFVHAGIITAGLDSACGIAAFTLMPGGLRHPDRRIQDQSAGAGERRALCVPRCRRQTRPHADDVRGRAYAEQDGGETLIATMTGTLMALPRREGAAAQD